MISRAQLHATDGTTYALRSFAWQGVPIVDACSVQAPYGDLLVLCADGTLHGVSLDNPNVVKLCSVVLPEIDGSDSTGPDTPALKLHASNNGAYAAIVIDRGQSGVVVETCSGSITMRLAGGDYFEHTVPFSACFLDFEGRTVLVHRTDWNRLDAADPVTGKSLSERFIAPDTESSQTRPDHYLDYFHGRLRPSPDGTRLFDDGWAWHPVAVPCTWSVTTWLGANPWECDDGASVVYFATRDDWNKPACWVGNNRIALWGLADCDDGSADDEKTSTGVRILDATASTQACALRWYIDLGEKSVRNMFSDGQRLYISADAGTTVVDIASGAPVTTLTDFTAGLHHTTRGSLIAIRPSAIVEFALPWPCNI